MIAWRLLPRGLLGLALLGGLLACAAPAPKGPPVALPEQAAVPGGEARGAATPRKHSDRFSNIELTNQFGERLRFYDDLIQNKAVIVNFFYTTCAKTCPGTAAQLAKMNDELVPWIGEDITMISLSIDPEVDTPERLKSYWELFGSKPGWQMLTGDEDEINRVRRQLGVYDLDPVIDADKAEHAGIITFGNDRTDRWAALPVFMHRERMLDTVLHTTRDREWGSRRSANVLSSEAETRRYLARGEVRAVFPERSEVVVAHGPIPGLMMAMTMRFPVTDPQLLSPLDVGDQIVFEVERRGETLQIVSASRE